MTTEQLQTMLPICKPVYGIKIQLKITAFTLLFTEWELRAVFCYIKNSYMLLFRVYFYEGYHPMLFCR